MAKQVQVWTKQAFETTLRDLHTMQNERDVAASLEYEFRKRSDDGLAFPTIVASGDNACTLHYAKCDEGLMNGRLLLLDFGVRHGSLCSDISRTVPIGGKFNPLQRLLYQIVLDTQAFHQNQVKPGKTLRELNLKAWEYLEELLRVRFLAKGGQMQRQYPRQPLDPSKPFSKGPHGISHLIGEQVHEGDPFRAYQDKPLRAGMMISNEPGLYGTFIAKFDGIRYEETIGIRIEDDLLITAKGCQNLSQDIPKNPDELELLLNH
jgi:Xaa-Pro aminopeptidase